MNWAIYFILGLLAHAWAKWAYIQAYAPKNLSFSWADLREFLKEPGTPKKLGGALVMLFVDLLFWPFMLPAAVYFYVQARRERK